LRLYLSDFHISFLRDAAKLVDSRIREIEGEAKRSDSSLAESIYDTGEYMYGYGLVACQQFISYCIAETSLDSKKALNLGPYHECGASIVSLVNALANRWKHEAGWGRRSTPQELQTMATLSRFGLKADEPYFTANALAILLRPHRPRIQRVIPFLRQWNHALRSAA
jgi:hypothetical protein